MSKNISTAFRNYLALGGGWSDALSNGRIKVYTESQPADADTAPSGTLLATFTNASAAYTAEVRAASTVLLAGSSGSLNTLTVAGIPLILSAVNFITDINTTAAAVATAINACQPVHGFTATASTATVTIKAPKNTGAYLNALTVAAGLTTLTATINGGSSTTLGGTGATAGVTAVNGLNFGVPAAGVLAKTSDTWSAVAVATGRAGWMRFEGEGRDDQSSGTTFIRFDCSIGTSGADINITNATMTAAAVQTFSPFSITVSQVQTGA
jgi:hypothetical protein